MISRLHRFHGHNSLSFVYRHGKTVRGSHLSLKFALNPRRKMYRAAVVVSRKVNKSAVVRNRIRRRIYETLRQHEDLIRGPYDLVVTAFSEQLAELDAATLQRMVVEQLERAHLDTPAPTANHGIVKPKD